MWRCQSRSSFDFSGVFNSPSFGTQRKASGVQGAAMSPLLADTKSAKASQDVSVLG